MLKRKQSKKTSRTKKVTKKIPDNKLSKEEIRAKLREKIAYKQLIRTPQYIRENEMIDIEEKLENKRLSGKERSLLKKRLNLLENIEENQVQNNDYTFYGSDE